MLLLKVYGLVIGVMSVIAFLMMGVDKLAAKLDKRRIPERTLMGTAALGGSAGAWLGMLLFRHKTKHRLFTLGIPALLCLHVVLLAVLLYLQTGGGFE